MTEFGSEFADIFSNISALADNLHNGTSDNYAVTVSGHSLSLFAVGNSETYEIRNS